MKAETRKQRSVKTAESTAAGKARLVLLVIGDPDLRRMLASQLRDAGYAAVEKTPGDDILGWSVENRPDVVIYDWIEEGGGALDFCRSFRADPRCAHSYLVMLIHGDPRDQVPRGLQAGANDFVAMPAQGANVLARLAVSERVLRIEAELRASNDRLQEALTSLEQAQEAIDRDLREARKLQQGLVRERGGRFGPFEMSLLLRPAGHIGGDLVGFFPIGEDRVGIYALDVSGHGVTAALLTAQLSVHLSGSSDQNVALRAAQSGSDSVRPAALAHFFNNMMLEEMCTDTYFTMIYADLNHVTGQLRIVQAGHPHPVLQKGDGSVRLLGRGGMPVGVFEEPVFDEVDVMLDPGDRLLITSDGITEASNPAGRLLGDDGLEAIMRTNAFLGGHSFLEAMAWSVSQYAGGERPDDMSAVLIEYLGPAKPLNLPAR
ncbi:MAG: PP2C family protein-serine/threonine phosphatase [Paracoccus sp. (in: a-proteobacteria)]|uniref:PP2C family protein-serine/threonine phosphatase n=1 Tax=unclassified Paracoccus (in: a-proteobacteria) TaxID=2688777 RepID=UPI000C5617A7|nr:MULTISPECIES: fused response regulator/phosphatase [unclassified Paracoccus (in: a-proteobacteria)]MAN56060.1 fused response regulator/phosphatase [Paracoccus sp. (in: a-proteobacteria)]MBA47619.1 fused response regulator/phosphatase [Paracoccus sp. (in: a-proteobacteria)]MCS5602134.1 fused response regulator/phosphatase [Paracoccus sp. (in: a-proteobacteria)]|tara:strand:- start:2247 stop:3542 length:1296 start_codon:yes stop_codon:yes gene_type:complete